MDSYISSNYHLNLSVNTSVDMCTYFVVMFLYYKVFAMFC